MRGLLIASSPVEIEAKAQAAGLPQAAHDMALEMFHALTARLGEAARSLDGTAANWPTHRFYFAAVGDPELSSLLDGLQSRPDFVEVADPAAASVAPTGLFARVSAQGFTAILVGHESHAGLPAPD